MWMEHKPNIKGIKSSDKKNIEGTRFILAISGGLDSVVLLNLILKIKKDVYTYDEFINIDFKFK